jgi:hypothetical protein
MANHFRSQFRSQMNLSKAPSDLGFRCLRITGSDSCQTEIPHRPAHRVRQLKPPPRWRLAQQLNPNPFSFRAGIA